MATEPVDGPGPDADSCLAVAPPYLPVEISADLIQFRTGPWSGPVVTVQDDDGEGVLSTLLEFLDGRSRLADILERFDPSHRQEVRSAVDRLFDRGILTEVTSVDRPRIDGYLAADPTVERPGTPLETSVLVVDTGPIGRMVADDLAKMGVGRVVHLPRSVEAAEPRRRPGEETVERLQRGTPLHDALDGIEYLVHTAHGPDFDRGRRINALASDEGIPSISARLAGLDGQVGPTVLPGRSACYECYYRRARSTLPDPFLDRVPVGTASRPDPLTAHARILAGWLVTEFVRLVANGTGFTLGGVVHFDFFDMTVEPNPVLKLPRCPTCGTADRTRVDVKRFVDHDRLLEDDR